MQNPEVPGLAHQNGRKRVGWQKKSELCEYQLFHQPVLVVIPTGQRRVIHIHLFMRVLGVSDPARTSHQLRRSGTMAWKRLL